MPNARVSFAEKLADILRQGTRNLLQRPRVNLPVLDVLRSIAILLVFCGHSADEFRASPAVIRFPFFYWGWTGVDLFFVLSGFLIGTQLWKELDGSHHIKVGRFLLRRGLRIWPLYYSFVALVALEAILRLRPSAGGLWSDAAFLSNYFHNQVGGGWSLSTEEQFYLLAPILIAVAARWVNPKHLWAIGLTILIPIVSRFALLHSGRDAAAVHDALYYRFNTHCDGLIVGLLLSWCWVFAPGLIRSSRNRISSACAMTVLAIGLYKLRPVLFNFTTLGLIYGAATILGLVSEVSPRFLKWNGFYVVSRLSYGVYLNHFGLLPWLAKWWLPWRLEHGEPAFWLCLALAFLASLVVAAITFYLIEWPFLLLRSRWLASQSKFARVPAGRVAAGPPIPAA